jgi:hypothetical protein
VEMDLTSGKEKLYVFVSKSNLMKIHVFLCFRTVITCCVSLMGIHIRR